MLDKLITELMYQVITPISEEITNRLLKYLGINEMFENRIYFHSSEQESSMDTNEQNQARLFKKRCDVEIKPNYNPKETKWDMFSTRFASAYPTTINDTFRTFPIFADRRNRIILHQFVVPCSVDLNFKLTVNSMELAEIINSALFNKFINESIYEYTDVEYSYPIPDVFIYMLHRMYKLTDNDPSELSFQDYITLGSNSKIGIIVNRDNIENKQLIYTGSLSRVLYNINYSADEPEPVMVEKVAKGYIISFTLSYQFSKPNMLRLSYPYIINNNPIPSEFIPKREAMSNDNMITVYPEQSINRIFKNINDYHNKYASYPFTQYPPNLDNNPIRILKIHGYDDKYFPIFAGVLQGDDDGSGNKSITVDILNEIIPLLPEDMGTKLNDAFDYQTIDDFLSFSGIFSLCVVGNEKYIINPNDITLDLENRTLFIDKNIDFVFEYKIIISMCSDIDVLSTNVVFKILEPDNELFFGKIIIDNINKLEKNGYIEILDKTGHWKKFIDEDPDKIQPYLPTILNNENPQITSDQKSSIFYYRGIRKISNYVFKVKN